MIINIKEMFASNKNLQLLFIYNIWIFINLWILLFPY